MAKHKRKVSQGEVIGLIVLGLLGLAQLVVFLLQGTDVALLNPRGFIAGEQRRLLLFSVVILLEIAIPSLVLFYFFAWKYRESNAKATYDDHTQRGKWFAVSIWAIPTMFMLILASIMWSETHRLVPQKTVAANSKPLTIQVVAMRWKWLFIYPEQRIATVNFVQVPVGTPVQFELTADETPMSSFWIPHWGGQLYAMTGHVNHLNLMAETPGVYTGSSAEINGPGFAGMKFTARASNAEEFNQWVEQVKLSSYQLDAGEYDRLLSPSENNPTAFYSPVQSNLYSNTLFKYSGSHDHHEVTE